MEIVLSKNNQKFIKIICTIAITFIILGIYPLHIIPTANISYMPDSALDWKQTEAITLSANDEVRQEYHPLRTMKFRAISLVIDSMSGNRESKLSVSVYDSKDNIVGYFETILSKLECRKKQIIPLKTKKMDANNMYYILFKIDGDASVNLFFVDKNTEEYFGKTYINSEAFDTCLLAELHTTEYTTRDTGIYVWIVGILFLAMIIVPWKQIGYVYLRIITILDLAILFLIMSYYQKIYGGIQDFSELKKLYMGFSIIAVMILLLHAYIYTRKTNRSVEKCFLVSVLGWGIIYLLLMPPYSYPDEPTHYAQSNAYVNQLMGHEVYDENGQIYIRTEELIDVVSFPDSDSLMDYYDGCFVRDTKPGYATMDIINGKGLSRASAICYIPFEIGIVIARILGLNYVWSFTLSNMLGLLYYTLIIYIAMRMMPMGKWILFLTAQFPLALSMATSFTYDMINYALLTLFFALFCKVYYDEREANWKQIVAFGVIGIIVFPIKYAYIPFCVLIVLLPNKKFCYKRAKIAKIVLVVVCLCAALSDNAILSGLGINNKTQGTVVEQTDVFDVKELYKVKESSWENTNKIIGDKSNLIKYTYNTLYAYLDYYWNGMIGMKIGWGDSFIPDFVYNIWWFLILLAIIDAKEERFIFNRKVRVGIFLICILSFGAIYLAMLLYATPVGYTDCPSVGARYLLPLLLPLCVALRGNKLILSDGISEEIFIWGVDFCQIIAMVYMFVGYVSR